MFTEKSIQQSEAIRARLREIRNANNGELSTDPGLEDWRKHLNDFHCCGLEPNGVVTVWKDGTWLSNEPLKVVHIEDGDLAMEEGCLRAYLQGRGLLERRS